MAHRLEVWDMISQLPKLFMSAPGWGFSEACFDCHGEQWTKEDRTIEYLFILGIALGYAQYATPREQWNYNPLRMPCLIVTI